MNAVTVIDGKVEPISCAIADAVLTEAVAEPTSALNRAEAALIAHRPALAAVKVEHDRADTSAVGAYGTSSKAAADAVFDEVDDRWMAALRRRDALAAAVMGVPVRTAADALRKQVIVLREYGCKGGGLYETDEEMAVAFTSALADLQTLAGNGPCEPIDFPGLLARYEALQADAGEAAYAEAWAALQTVFTAPCSTVAAALAKVRALLIMQERDGGSNWTGQADRMALEQVRDALAGLVPPDPDAALHEAVKELDRRWAAERLAEADKMDDDLLTAACNHTSEAAAGIMALPPAQTLAGLRIKARAIAWCFSEDKPEFSSEHGHPTAADRWADQLFEELIRGPDAAPPPSAIQTIKADIDKLGLAINAATGDDEAELVDRMAELEDRLRDEPCRSLADLTIKAQLAKEHEGEVDFGGLNPFPGAPLGFLGDDFGTAVARALVRDVLAMGRVA